MSSSSTSSPSSSSAAVLVACTSAYPEAAGTLAPNIDFNIAEPILTHFASLPSAPSVTLLHCSRLHDAFSALLPSPSRPVPAAYAAVPIESSETGAFRSVYEFIVNYACHIVGEFAVSSDVPTTGGQTAAASSPPAAANTAATATATATISTLWTRFVILATSAALQSHTADSQGRAVPSSSVLSASTPSSSCSPSLSSSLTSFGSGRSPLKCSAVLGLSHEAGSVHRILSCFSMRHINVLKFELRPATPASFLVTVKIPAASSASSASSSASSDRPPLFRSASVPTSPRHSAAVSPFVSSSSQSHANYVFLVDWELPSGSSSEATNAALVNNLREFSVRMVQLGTYKQNMQVREAEELVLAW